MQLTCVFILGAEREFSSCRLISKEISWKRLSQITLILIGLAQVIAFSFQWGKFSGANAILLHSSPNPLSQGWPILKGGCLQLSFASVPRKEVGAAQNSTIWFDFACTCAMIWSIQVKMSLYVQSKWYLTCRPFTAVFRLHFCVAPSWYVCRYVFLYIWYLYIRLLAVPPLSKEGSGWVRAITT